MKIYVEKLNVEVKSRSITIMEAIGRRVEVILSDSNRELELVSFYSDNKDVWITFKTDDHFERYCINLRRDAENLCTFGYMEFNSGEYKYEEYKGIVFVS